MRRYIELIITGLDRFAYLVYTRALVLIIIFALILTAAIYYSQETVDCSTGCVGVNLMSRDLSQQNLSRANLIEANFQFTNLSHGNLYAADLSGANLRGANLQNADLRQTKLLGANLAGADLRNALLDDTDLSGADLSRADLTRADLTTVILQGAILEGAKLVEADLHNTNLSGVALDQADLTGANLNGALLSGSSLSQANLSGTSAISTNMSGAWINLANLTGADFRNSELAGTSFIGTNLTSVNFTQSNLVGGVFIGAQLNGANLTASDLSGTRLFLSELKPSDLMNDPLIAELNELQRIEIIKNVDLSGVTFDNQTTWPAGKSTPLEAILGARFRGHTGLTDTANVQERIASVPNKGYFGLPPIDPTQVTGDITIAGSTALVPLTELISSMFSAQGYTGTISIAETTTNDGFQRYCDTVTSIDLVHANRSITPEERDRCRENKDIAYSFQVGYGTIAIIINPTNPFLTDITSDQLSLLLTTERWSNINPQWPANPIIRYLPNSESDTFIQLVDTVFSGDETPLLDAPNMRFADISEIVLGVTSNVNAIGIVSYPYYKQNTETINILTIDGLTPTAETISKQQYRFSYPIYFYTDKTTISEKPQILDFLNFYFTYSNILAEDVGYFPLSTLQLDQQEYRLLNLKGFGTDEN